MALYVFQPGDGLSTRSLTGMQHMERTEVLDKLAEHSVIARTFAVRSGDALLIYLFDLLLSQITFERARAASEPEAAAAAASARIITGKE